MGEHHSRDLKKIRETLKEIQAEVQERGFLSGVKMVLTASFIKFAPVLGFMLLPFCAILRIKVVNIVTSRIGHLCVDADCYIKEEILGKHPKYRAVILSQPRRGTVANEHMLSYWERYFAVIRSPVLCRLLKPLLKNPLTCFDVSRYAFAVNESADFPWIQDAYHKSGGRPLLSLSAEDQQRGWDALQRLGMPRAAWFVSIHCREDGYRPGGEQTYRNATIDSYFSAMETIVERGGWVIRLGDQSMEVISPRKNVIDYAHTDAKSDWMDIFLCASCKLLLGSASGLAAVSGVFGVPSAIAHQTPMSVVLPFLPDDIGIPKLVYSQTENRYLKFAEILRSPIGNFRHGYLLDDAQVCGVDNRPEDVNALLIEMLDRIDGKLSYTDEDNMLQERFKSLMGPTHYSYRSVARIGRDFLREYSFLLDDDEPVTAE